MGFITVSNNMNESVDGVRLPLAVVVVDRLSVLLSSYPALGCAVALVLLVPGLMPSYSSSVGLAVPIFCLQYTCCAVAAVTAHFYDLARLRLQTLATTYCQQPTTASRAITIQRDFGFADVQLQEEFECWEARSGFWRGVDWLSVGFAIECHLKMLAVRECRRSAFYQLWALGLSLLMLYRVLKRPHMSSSTYSMLSLASQIYAWGSHVFFLWSGDCCFGSFGAEFFASGAIPSQTLMSCATFFFMYLLCPVSQPYVPLKTATGFVGSVVSCYMHILIRNCTMDVAVDPDRWSFFWIFSGLVVAAALCFNVSTTLSEAGMSRYLLTIPDRRRRDPGSQ
jgi:hypothetical protein